MSFQYSEAGRLNPWGLIGFIVKAIEGRYSYDFIPPAKAIVFPSMKPKE